MAGCTFIVQKRWLRKCPQGQSFQPLALQACKPDFEHSLSKAIGSSRTLMLKFSPTSQQLSSRLFLGLLFLPPKLQALGQESMVGKEGSYIYLTIFSCHLTDSSSSPSLLQYSLYPWATPVLMFSNAALLIGLLKIQSPETAVVSAWHPPAGSLSYPGVSVWLPSITTESTVRSECSSV